jgi:septal ring factor EnvC (AmiA/AmiB activator)
MAGRQEERVIRNGNGKGNGAALFARLAAVEGELAELDVELAAAERARDAATRALSDPDHRPTALRAFAHEEDRDQANERIGELLERRRPLAEQVARLHGYADPLTRHRQEVEQQQAAVRVIERLRQVFPLLDQAIEIIDAARPDAARAGIRAPIPSSLERLCAAWRADHRGLVGMAPSRFSAEYNLDVAAARERLARLLAGVP